jgi:O-antigen/teichoic acid export membrane protein
LDYVGIKNTIKNWMPPPIKSLLERVESSPLGQRLARGTFWTLVGVFISRGLNMAAMIFLARMLGKNEFGEIGVIQTTVGMIQTLAGFGLGWAATKYVAEFRKSDPAKAGRIISFSNLAALATGGIMALIFFAAAPWLAVHTLASPQLVRPLQVSSLILLFGTLAGTQNGTLAGFEAFQSIARIGLWSGIVSVPLIIGGGWFYGVEGAVWGMSVSMLANWLMNYRNLRREAKQEGIEISSKGCLQEYRLLWDFSFPAILGGTAFNVATWVGTMMLVNSPGGYGEMGYYNAANQWFSVLLFLPGVLGQAAIPVLSEQIAKKDVGRTKKILIYSIRLNAVIILPIVVFGSIFSPWIMRLYGQDYGVAWATLVFTFFAAGITALQSPAAQVISAFGRMWKVFLMNLSWGVVFIITVAGFIEWGSLGLAVGRSIAYLIYAFLSFIFTFSLIRHLHYNGGISK